MTGRIAIFAIVERNMAMMGRRERGRGICIRAKDAPRRMSESGTAMSPRNWAISAFGMSEHVERRLLEFGVR